MTKKILVGAILAVLPLLSGCAALKLFSKKPKPALPIFLVQPIRCSNFEVSDKITMAFTKGLTKKVQPMDPSAFIVWVSSLSEGAPPARSEGDVAFAALAISSVSYSDPKFFRDLARSEPLRTKMLLEYGLRYSATGEAREKKLSELEAGNLQTAETAYFRVLDLKLGKVILEDDFAQGSFEIVAPERIGSRFASKINKKLEQMRKEEERREKRLRKNLKI